MRFTDGYFIDKGHFGWGIFRWKDNGKTLVIVAGPWKDKDRAERELAELKGDPSPKTPE